jgi:lysyl-tRNA synthetase class 2
MELLRLRARLLAETRRFFAERSVLEVETPVLSEAATTDAQLESLYCRHAHPESGLSHTYFLHTSPELAMKRLLAAGSGPIYQICKVFRRGELGRRHNPEFTMIEWYRPDFNHHDLMDEVDDLIRRLLGSAFAERMTYADGFNAYVGLDPHAASLEQLREAAQPRLAKAWKSAANDRATLLELLFSHHVAPELGNQRPAFLYDFPSCLAALARIQPGKPAVAERFELFIDGMEVASGYHELVDPVEQRVRFELDNQRRERLGQNRVPVDQRFLSALESGIGPCAGVAVGLDRLLMVLSHAKHIRDVLPFPFDRA